LSRWAPGKKTPKSVGRAYVGFWFHCSPNPYAPQIDASASAERQKGPPFALGIRPNHDLPTYSLYSAGATASFTPDVFGLTGRRVEQQQALAQNQAYQLAAAQLAVTGNVVHQTLTIAAARQQIAALDATVAADEKTLALVRQKYTDGKLARDDVLTVRAQLANDRALLPPMRQEVAVAQDALAILVGVAPASFSPPDFDLADFTLPAETFSPPRPGCTPPVRRSALPTRRCIRASPYLRRSARRRLPPARWAAVPTWSGRCSAVSLHRFFMAVR
jgi:outer membrane protein TolC